MRLICPNCETEYEVHDNMIPAAGRDVQCSNCMRTWFQSGPTKAEPETAEDLKIDGGASAPTPARKKEVVDRIPSPPPPPAADDYEDEADETSIPPAAIAQQRRKPKLDAEALSVIEEEVSRERQARKADAENIETQIDLGINDVEDRVSAARERMAQNRTSDVVVEEVEEVDLPQEDVIPVEPAAKRELLPDIEEINSTLADAPEHDDLDEHMEMMPQRHPKTMNRRGFRLGFGLMLMVAAALVGLYVYAPTIAQKIPAMAGFIKGYVGTLDGLRVWLDGSAQDLVDQITKLIGSV